MCHTPIDIYVYTGYNYRHTKIGKNMKKCSVCNENKDLEKFDKRRNSKGEQVPTSRCKDCRRDYIRKYNRSKSFSTGMSKEEWINSVRKPRLSSEEKAELARAKWEAWHKEWLESGAIEEARAEAERKRLELLESGVKFCTMCNEEKPISQFHIRTRTRKDGSKYKTPYAHCKTCRKVDNRSYETTPAAKIAKKRNNALRDSRNRQATPKWLTKEQKQQIVDVYNHMRDCRAITGEDYHVDHIIPLKGENVCGLHVPWNLQVLPADVNMSKANKI